MYERRDFAFIVGKRIPGTKEAVLTLKKKKALKERLKKYDIK